MQPNSSNLLKLLEGCQRGERLAQRMLFKEFYSFGMNLCMRYAANYQEAQEMLNDGFFKVLTKIDQFDAKFSFLPWLKTVLINSAIDYHRRKKMMQFKDIESATEIVVEEDILNDLAYEDVLKVVQQLTPAYRTVFNLYVIEGFKHREIAEQLNISIGTSKSNLAQAKRKLQQLLQPILSTKLN